MILWKLFSAWFVKKVDKIWHSVTILNLCSTDRIWASIWEWIFQTQFSIKNTLDGSRFIEKCTTITRALAKGNFFRKRWRVGPKKQRSFRSVFVVAGKIIGFESPEPILDGGQWNRIVLKCTRKFFVNQFTLVSFEKAIFYHHSLLDSINPNIHHIYLKCQLRKVLSARPYGQFSHSTYMIDSQIDLVSRLLFGYRQLSLLRKIDRVRYFSPPCIIDPLIRHLTWEIFL
jgi:hypothetical protein